jgi:hypothetical protein
MSRWSGFRGAALALALLPVAAKAVAQSAPDKHAELSAQANNPNAPLLQTYLQYGFVPETKGLDGHASELQLLAAGPVLLPRFLTAPQLFRLEVPLLTTPNPDRVTGLGDIDLVDVVMVVRKKTLSLGVGIATVLPTATSPKTGGGKWQLGPASASCTPGFPTSSWEPSSRTRSRSPGTTRARPSTSCRSRRP